ncbi:MAG: tRNA preQ1(34) S-adenosylmethionine ribosyltransferase-isomerase QueA [Planctomycetota bacterium]
MLRTDDLDFDLPDDRIATHAIEPRDAARLLVVDREIARAQPHPCDHVVRELPDLLRPGDLLVFNTTRVLPARFVGAREDTGGGVQGLYLHDDPEPGVWRCLVKSRRFKPGAVVRLADRQGAPSEVTMTLIERADAEAGAWRVRVEPAGSAPDVLNHVGRTPLPPYIRSARKSAGEHEDAQVDVERYQTVYAEAEAASVAAPTAGLHFTPDLLARLAAMGVERADVTLHVGAGTFKPIETERVEDHPMHAEWCAMSSASIEAVRAVRADPARRVIAVGTTTARTLESYAAAMASAGSPPAHLDTALLITPGYEWHWVEGLLTNFHLPRSTLLAMVGALLHDTDLETDAANGLTRLKALYRHAIDRDYRFYSYGDAMLILP